MKRSESFFYDVKNRYAGLSWYLIPLGLFWLCLALLIVAYGVNGSFILINSFTASGSNKLLAYLTVCSGGLILSALFVLIAARTWPVETPLGMLLVFIAWYTCITVKYNAFAGWKSPENVFGANHFRLLKSTLQPELNFPSVHATVIAALGTYIACFYRYSPPRMILIWMSGTFLLMLRVLAGWSFVSDILAGSLLGTFSCLCCILWLQHRVERWYDRRDEWWQGIIVATLRTAAIRAFS